MDNTQIKLKYPVSVDGVTTESLILRRPKVRDMLVASKGGGNDAEREVRLFANLCEVAPAVIEELDIADHAAVSKVYAGFLS